jgi:lipoate-protein ligase A
MGLAGDSPTSCAASPSRQLAASWSIWIDPAGHTGAWNMAADSALLHAAQRGEAWLRLYRWEPGCLSFGRNEPALTRYDRDRIAAFGLDTVRRPTGGRAVWHDAEVTYAVAAPIETFGSLTETYLAIHRIVAQALGTLGIEATIARHPSGGHAGLGAGSCFASPAGGEVIVHGRKLVGSAQVREGNAFLQHGSILLEDGQDIVAKVTRGNGLPVLATSAGTLLQRPVTFAEVCNAIAGEPSADWSGASVSRGRAPEPGDVERFANPDWTWRR